MKQTSLAARYARALAEVVRENNLLEATAQELEALSRLYLGSKDFRDFLLNPAYPTPIRKKGLAEVAKLTRASQPAMRLLEILLVNGRMELLPEVSESFRKIEEDTRGRVSVELTTARPLDSGQHKQVEASLERFTGRKVRLMPRVDPAVLGGARTRIGTVVYDGTVATLLEKLKQQLLGER
ncbi:MAG: ATP synthase F1 subunit delta [Acidobacteria bacterium]|nr:MAG: ATP synthase F1 subunit delta [Acidobacteriota bacterium]